MAKYKIQQYSLELDIQAAAMHPNQCMAAACHAWECVAAAMHPQINYCMGSHK